MSDPVEIIDEGKTDVAGFYIIRGSGMNIDELVPSGIEHVLFATYRYVFVTSSTDPLATKDILEAADFDGHTLMHSMSTLSNSALDGLRSLILSLGARNLSVLSRHVNRHDDLFLADTGDCIVPCFEGSAVVDELPDDMIVHQTSFDALCDAYLLYKPESLSASQRGFMAEVARYWAEHKPSSHGSVEP